MLTIQEICHDCDATIEEIRAALEAASELAPSEPPGPTGSLRCDGVVGLRVESAEALCLQWHARSVQLRADAKGVRNAACWPLAVKANAEAATYEKCIEELRRQMGAATVRQPEPNIEVTDAKRSV
jgi:hypothetical protein